MSDTVRIPLAEVMVRCSICEEQTSAADINADRTRYHPENGSMIRLPDVGLTKNEIAELNAIFLRCECCREDHEEKQEC
jgi:hypothetical protein